MYLSLVAIVVKEYDPAIDFFVGTLGFELVENFPSLTNDGRPKRWVVVRPPGAQTRTISRNTRSGSGKWCIAKRVVTIV